MLNNSTIVDALTAHSVIVAYYPLALIVVGTVFNLFTFIILYQRSFQGSRSQPTIDYMRAIALFDILMLYGWNLDHYIFNIYGFLLQRYSILFCKLLSFLNYFAAQSSAWLRVGMCFDRFMSLRHLPRTVANRSKHTVITMTGIIVVVALFNLHFIFFACFYESDGNINVHARHYRIYPLWDYINLGLYNCIPFILMVLCNSGVIFHLIRLRRMSTVRNSRIHHRAISITLVLTSFLFLLMTIPATVSFAFFYSKASITLLHALDSLLYTYHISSFPLYLITFREFRRECVAMFTDRRQRRRTSSVYSRSSRYTVEKF